MAAGDLQPVDSTKQIADLLSMIKGSKSTQTTGSNISGQGMQALLDQMLASSQGLGAMSGQQKAAGMYGSTTNKMQMADFMSRAAGQLEAQRAGTTTTTRTPGKLGGKDLLSMIAMQGGKQLLGPTVKGLGKKAGLGSGTDPLESVGKSIADYFGLGESATTGSMSPVTFGGGGSFSPTLTTGLEGAFGSGVGTLGSTAALSAEAAGLAELGATYGVAEAGAGTLGIGFGGEAAAGLGAALEAGALGTAGATAGTAAAVGAGEALGTAAVAAEGATLWATLAEVGTWIAALFSDERLKTDIKEVGSTKEGQTIYTYKYIDNPITTHMGVMAQETLKFHPEAVIKHPSGALMVNYDHILGAD